MTFRSVRVLVVVCIVGVPLLAACSSGDGGSSAISTTAVGDTGDSPTTSDAPAIDLGANYVLTTLALGTAMCLQGDDPSLAIDGSGAAFMAPCTDPNDGQVWTLIPFEDSYLLTNALLGDSKCLEGNDPTSADASFAGAAFMAPCADPATGQMWNLAPQADGSVLLTTAFRGEGECLEGNDPASAAAARGGAAFLAPCTTPATGQSWMLVVA